MLKDFDDDSWHYSTQEERDQWYKDYKVACIGNEDDSRDRCGFIKRKYQEWGLDNSKILDFPCHDGFVTRGFLKHGSEIVGFDIGVDCIDKSIELAQHKYPKEKGFKWDYSVASTSNFKWNKYKDEFDLVVCFEFIEHILRADVDKVLKQINSVTAKGGYITISTPDIDGQFGTKDVNNKSHINLYTKDDLLKQIKKVLGVNAELEGDGNFYFVWWRK